MPAELPGLYWDEARNRYFPLSTRPKPPPPQVATISSRHRKDDKLTDRLSVPQRDHTHYVPWHSSIDRMSRSCYTRTRRDAHEILCFHFANTSLCGVERLPTLGPIQAFRSARVGGKIHQFAGDDQGWLYTRTISGPEHTDGHRWHPEPIVRSSERISSISTSDTHCVVASLGPGKVSVQNMHYPERLFVLNFTSIHDIWTTSLCGSTLALGGSKKASYLSDIDLTRTPEHLVTNSDVFSIAQQHTLVYAGTRSGSVHRFDMRMSNHRNQKLFDNRFGSTPRSSVLHLDVIREYEIFMSHLNGDLVTYDLRFAPESANASPVKIYDGHVNTHTQNLGITIDHERDFIYAAGQDCRIRAWSLRTGSLLTPSQHSTRRIKQTNPLLDTFPDPIHTLQVVDDADTGVALWAACGREIYQYRLGQRWEV